MHRKSLILFGIAIVLGLQSTSKAEKFYEKPEIQKRMEKREVVSVVKVRPHEEQPDMQNLSMLAAGVVEGITPKRAMEIMSDYGSLHKIAPQYITKSELIVRRKKEGGYRKYVYMKTQVSALLMTYKVEVYAIVRDELTPDSAIVHWEIIPAASIGRKAKKEKYVGLKGQIIVRKYQRAFGAKSTAVRHGRGLRRARKQKDPLMVLFQGKMIKKDMSPIVPNFMVQFAMEVALQRVGILLRNYIEKAKDSHRAPDLEVLAIQEERLFPSTRPASE